jgi:hypothetical protein
MKSEQLILKCYVEPEEGAWVAVCLDFNLAAQAESSDAARRKLEAMILSYVREALTVDREYADQLLTRKAPWPAWVRYYLHVWLARLSQHSGNAFHEVMPLRPA